MYIVRRIMVMLAPPTPPHATTPDSFKGSTPTDSARHPPWIESNQSTTPRTTLQPFKPLPLPSPRPNRETRCPLSPGSRSCLVHPSKWWQRHAYRPVQFIFSLVRNVLYCSPLCTPCSPVALVPLPIPNISSTSCSISPRISRYTKSHAE